jgi:spermidine synthase
MLRSLLMPITVFITGGCVLVIEIVATRILSPYFGTTIFTVSSIISTVLAALSFGYLFGGKLSDRYPRESLFYTIIAVSGASVLLLQLLATVALPQFGYSFSLVTGPLIASVILFFIPAFLLGMISPFAIKLEAKRTPERGIGSIAGSIFFWSTLGSIIGSLGAGFLLIPHIGITTIVTGVGIVLVIVGVVPLATLPMRRRLLSIGIVLAISVVSVVGASAVTVENEHIVYGADGLYERITIVDGIYNNQPTRFLLQDRTSSAAMFLESDELVYNYTKYYEVYKGIRPTIASALAIGGGAYSVPKALLKEPGIERVDVAEIEPSLVALAEQYFRLPTDERLHHHLIDGRRFLHDAEHRYDLIFSDVYYSLFSIPQHFTTQEFFALAKSRLSNNGVFVANFIGSLSREEPSLILSVIKTFKSVFPNSQFFAAEFPFSSHTQNILIVGINGDAPLDLGLLPDIRDKRIPIEQFNLSGQLLLTDNYAPIDTLTAAVIKGTEHLPPPFAGTPSLGW